MRGRIFINMQQRTVVSNGKRYLVNVATDDGIGAGFAVGQLVLKSATDGKWYVATASGSAGSVVAFVSQSALAFPTGSDGTSYYNQNYPYQLIASTDGNAYAVYLTGTAPAATFVVSQSAYGKAYITSSNGAIIDMSKPYLLLQNISNGDYYRASLSTNAGTTTLVVSQNAISQSWVHPIY